MIKGFKKEDVRVLCGQTRTPLSADVAHLLL